MPDAALLSSQPRWSYFMIWSEQLQGSNTNAQIQATYFNAARALPGRDRARRAAAVGAAARRVPARSRVSAASASTSQALRHGRRNGRAALHVRDRYGAQTWTVKAPSGTGTVVNPSSGKCLDVTGQGTADGTKVQLWTCNGSGAQQWTYDGQRGDVPQPGVRQVPGRHRPEQRRRHPPADLDVHRPDEPALDPSGRLSRGQPDQHVLDAKERRPPCSPISTVLDAGPALLPVAVLVGAVASWVFPRPPQRPLHRRRATQASARR